MIANAFRGSDFAGLLTYLINNRSLAPDAVRISSSLASLETAAHEMTLIAAGNGRCRAPVRHLCIGWHETEAPTLIQQHECAEALLRRLGVEDHQNVRVIHTHDRTSGRASGNGRHFEMHIMINAVGFTGRAPCSTRDHKTIERAVASVAAELGFRQVPGRFNGVAGTFTSLNGPAASLAAQTGIPTIAAELIADPDRLEALKAARRQSKETASWIPLLQELDRQGLRLERAKDRGTKHVRGLIMVDQTNPKRRQKCSALDTPDLKWGEGALTAALGPLPSDLMFDTDKTLGGPAQEFSKASSSQAGPLRQFSKEVDRRMRPERSRIHAEFVAAQDRTRQEREQILAVRKAAWAKFQSRRSELLAAARTRRTIVYKLFPKHPLVRLAINRLFDVTKDRRIREARELFLQEKGLALPSFARWTTWSPDRLKDAKTRVETELRAEMARQAVEAARRANENLVRNSWKVGSDDHLRMHWNVGARSADTTQVRELADALIKAGLTSVAAENAAQISLSAVVSWIGTGADRMARLDLVERAAEPSRRETARLREEDDQRATEERARKAAEADEAARQDAADMERRYRAALEDVEKRIRRCWGVDPAISDVLVRWNTNTRRTSTKSSEELMATLGRSGRSPKMISETEARVAISDLVTWVDIIPGERQEKRFGLLGRAARASADEAQALQRDEETRMKAETDAALDAERARVQQAKEEEARAWAQRWIDAAPRAEQDGSRLEWIIGPEASPRGKHFRDVVGALLSRQEFQPAWIPHALLGYQAFSISSERTLQGLVKISPADRSQWDETCAALTAESRRHVSRTAEVRRLAKEPRKEVRTPPVTSLKINSPSERVYAIAQPTKDPINPMRHAVAAVLRSLDSEGSRASSQAKDEQSTGGKVGSDTDWAGCIRLALGVSKDDSKAILRSRNGSKLMELYDAAARHKLAGIAVKDVGNNKMLVIQVSDFIASVQRLDQLQPHSAARVLDVTRAAGAEAKASEQARTQARRVVPKQSRARGPQLER